MDKQKTLSLGTEAVKQIREIIANLQKEAGIRVTDIKISQFYYDEYADPDIEIKLVCSEVQEIN